MTSSTKSKSNVLVLPSLGRPFQLGMLYDCRNDRLIPGLTLWDDSTLKAALSETPQPSSAFDVTAEDSVSTKMFNLGVEANLSVSVLSGLVEVSGSAKYVDDRQSSSKHARVTLKYKCTSKFQQLTMEQLATSKIQHPSVFEKQTATHVVTGVLYGAEAFFIFDREVESSENHRKIHGKMKILVKAIPGGINKIEGSASLDINDGDKKEVDKFQCKFYGDLILPSNPSTFEDAVRVYKELPTHFLEDGGHTVPKKVWLYPLSGLDSKAARMVREISTSLVTQVQQVIEILNNMEIRSHDLINTEVYDCFGSLKDQVLEFQDMIKEHKTDFMKRLSAVLPSIRGGGTEEQELASLLEKSVHSSPFNTSSLQEWIGSKEEEIKVLGQFLGIMKKAQGVKLAFGAGDLESALSDIAYDHILSFEFKVLKKEDPFLQNMFSFLRIRDTCPVLQTTSKPWYKTDSIIRDLRLKSKQFTSFANANTGSKEVMFLTTDTSDNESADTNDTGAVIMHYEIGSSLGEFDPPSKPNEKPKADVIEHNSVQLQWKAPKFGSKSIEKYTVSYRCTNESEDMWTANQVTTEKETAITINQLKPESCYVFKVCANTALGHSGDSDLSDIIKTKPPLVDFKLQNLIADSKVIETKGPPTLYKLKTRPIQLQKNYTNIAKMELGIPAVPARPTRVLMIVGATGAGKSTLINGMVNHFFGVKLEHKFRFKLIHDEVSESQAHSQTQMVTAYTLYWQEGSPLNCNLVVIDTPGFGDTRGLERDRAITTHIREFFQIKGNDGLDMLHAICFVSQASLARLTPTQQYIFDSILSVFGKNITNNIFIMTTFADEGDPPVMGAIREAKIPHADFFPFNNSTLFVDPKISQFAEIHWQNRYKSFSKFFIQFEQVSAVSLQLTREVLEERHQLETIVLGIQPKIDAGLAKIDELQQEEKMLESKKSEVLANKDFTYQIKVTKQRKIDLPQGQYVTNCAECHFTCHSKCGYADDQYKWKCSAMDNGDESNATCRVCPGRCSWRKHFNNGYHFELYEEMETRTSKDLQKRYNQAKSDTNELQNMIGGMEKDLQELQKTVLYSICQARDCLKRLDEIALKPNPLTEVEYIDLLIASEKDQKKPGWKHRIDHLRIVRQHAQILANVNDPKEFEKLAQRSSKFLWKKITGWLKSDD